MFISLYSCSGQCCDTFAQSVPILVIRRHHSSCVVALNSRQKINNSSPNFHLPTSRTLGRCTMLSLMSVKVHGLWNNISPSAPATSTIGIWYTGCTKPSTAGHTGLLSGVPLPYMLPLHVSCGEMRSEGVSSYWGGFSTRARLGYRRDPSFRGAVGPPRGCSCLWPGCFLLSRLIVECLWSWTSQWCGVQIWIFLKFDTLKNKWGVCLLSLSNVCLTLPCTKGLPIYAFNLVFSQLFLSLPIYP